ncbi:hypothetical protein BDZ88DRAFT_452557 [Geranomyces variabilis]|nr:hypothetical protein BDZ88DRAFT_452557 [Geranomyces variabilis]KAJ3135157.1 hypothetical protein HDU90_004189 [Geranomyces variabilis]
MHAALTAERLPGSTNANTTPWPEWLSLVFTPTTPWRQPGRKDAAPLGDGTIPPNRVRLNTQYRGSLLGYNDYDYVAWRNKEWADQKCDEWEDEVFEEEDAAVFVLDDLLDDLEIRQLLRGATDCGWGAPHNKYGVLIDDPAIRSDVAVTITSETAATELWKRIPNTVQADSFGATATSRVERANYSSEYTLLVYLTDVHHGGETRFINERKNLVMDIPPRAGRAVIFDYNVVHCGLPVLKGEKIILKTDVMIVNQRAMMPPGALD